LTEKKNNRQKILNLNLTTEYLTEIFDIRIDRFGSSNRQYRYRLSLSGCIGNISIGHEYMVLCNISTLAYETYYEQYISIC